MKELVIIEVLARNTTVGYTIHQLSKILKKSYAFTNNLARDLISQGILNKLVVGNAILCTLNLENELTRALLTVASVNKKQANMKKLESLDAQIINKLKRKFTVECIYLKNKELNIVCRNEAAVQEFLNERDLGFKFRVLEKEDVSEQKFEDIIVVYGFERFWEVIADA